MDRLGDIRGSRILDNIAMIYTPEPYQKIGISFLKGQPAAGLFADPGGGKTAAIRAAIEAERDIEGRAFIDAMGKACSGEKGE